MLTPELQDRDKEWKAIFDEILFPLITQLLKPEVFGSDPVGMGETRVQAAQLLCRIFLHYLVVLSEWEGMVELWSRILGVMDRLTNSGQGDTLVSHITRTLGPVYIHPKQKAFELIHPLFMQEEAVAENMKNILLVMASQGILAPPSEKPQNEVLWNETWKRLDRFLPQMFAEVFPEEAQKPRTSGGYSRKEVMRSVEAKKEEMEPKNEV